MAGGSRPRSRRRRSAPASIHDSWADSSAVPVTGGPRRIQSRGTPTRPALRPVCPDRPSSGRWLSSRLARDGSGRSRRGLAGHRHATQYRSQSIQWRSSVPLSRRLRCVVKSSFRQSTACQIMTTLQSFLHSSISSFYQPYSYLLTISSLFL